MLFSDKKRLEEVARAIEGEQKVVFFLTDFLIRFDLLTSACVCVCVRVCVCVCVRVCVCEGESHLHRQ